MCQTELPPPLPPAPPPPHRLTDVHGDALARRVAAPIRPARWAPARVQTLDTPAPGHRWRSLGLWAPRIGLAQPGRPGRLDDMQNARIRRRKSHIERRRRASERRTAVLARGEAETGRAGWGGPGAWAQRQDTEALGQQWAVARPSFEAPSCYTRYDNGLCSWPGLTPRSS